MLMPRFVEGSVSRGRTIHGEGRYHGWFDLKQRNRPHWRPISWKVRYLEVDRPRWSPTSWMAQGQQGEPSMLMPRFMEGSVSRSEPSTPKTDIVDGSI